MEDGWVGCESLPVYFLLTKTNVSKADSRISKTTAQKVLQTQPSCSICKYVHIGHVVKSNGANWKSVLICSTVNIWCKKLWICIQYALYCWFQLTHPHSILRHSSTVKIMPLCMDACKIQPPPGATSFSRSARRQNLQCRSSGLKRRVNNDSRRVTFHHIVQACTNHAARQELSPGCCIDMCTLGQCNGMYHDTNHC